MTFAKRHLARVHDLPCGLCDARPVEAHHVMEGRTPGRKSDDRLAIPLCVGCHRGSKGAHGDKTMFKIYKKSELDILADTIEKVYG